MVCQLCRFCAALLQWPGSGYCFFCSAFAADELRIIIKTFILVNVSGSGKSCHQCKSRKDSSELYFCKNNFMKKSNADETRQCHKKFCLQCLQKRYASHLVAGLLCGEDIDQQWACPSCCEVRLNTGH